MPILRMRYHVGVPLCTLAELPQRARSLKVHTFTHLSSAHLAFLPQVAIMIATW